MQAETIQSIEGKVGNVYGFMNLKEEATSKEIKKAYKILALKFHPDKNPDAADTFLKIKLCYDVLTSRKEEYDMHLFAKKTTALRFEKYDTAAKNLIEKEKAAQEAKQKEKQEYAEEMLKKRRKREEENQREQDILEKQRQMDEKMMKTQFKQFLNSRDNSEVFRKINSVQVTWTQEAIYDEELLTMLFEAYGPIKTIQVISDKNMGVIQFFQTIGADKAVQDNQDTAELKVSYLKKAEKRKKYIEKLGLQKKQQKTDLSLSSQNLNKISQILNQDSKVYLDSLQKDFSRQSERDKYMQEVIEKEIIQDMHQINKGVSS